MRKVGAAEFAEMIIDQVQEMLAQAEQQPLVAGIALHPYIVGQPFRLRHLRRALEYLASLGTQIWLTHPGTVENTFGVCRDVSYTNACKLYNEPKRLRYTSPSARHSSHPYLAIFTAPPGLPDSFACKPVDNGVRLNLR